MFIAEGRFGHSCLGLLQVAIDGRADDLRSAGYKAIVGGIHPHHFVDISGKNKEEVAAILDGTDPKYGEIEEATEIKLAVVTFQNIPPGVSPKEVIAERPQSNNDSNEFIKLMETAASVKCLRRMQHASTTCRLTD